MTTETLPATTPLEPTTPIRPSEAIRLGCLTTLPCEGALFGPTNEACAIGAALVGWYGWEGAAEHGYGYVEFERRTGDRYLLGCDGTCDTARLWTKPMPSSEVVYHLNDTHRWSRERIADWLAEQGL